MKKALIAIAALCILTGCLGKIGKDAVIKYEFISSVKPIPGHEYVDENDSFLAEQDLLKDFVRSMDPEDSGAEAEAFKMAESLANKFSGQLRNGTVNLKKVNTETHAYHDVLYNVKPKQTFYLFENNVTGSETTVFASTLKVFVRNTDALPLLEKQEMVKKVEDELISKFDKSKLKGTFCLKYSNNSGTDLEIVREWTF